MRNEKGISLLEVMLAILIITFTVASMMKALSQSVKGEGQVRNRLRAGTLIRAKLDTLKDYTHQAALGGNFSSVTVSPLVTSYAVTQTALIENKPFIWNISSTFVTMTGVSIVVDVTSATVTTKLVRYKALVTWNEGPYAKFITQTAIVSDPANENSPAEHPLLNGFAAHCGATARNRPGQAFIALGRYIRS